MSTTVLSETLNASQLWHRDVPAKFHLATDPTGHPRAWNAWSAHLAKRKKPVPLSRRLPDAKAPLLWVLPLESAPRDEELLETLDKLSRVARGKSAPLPDEAAIEAWLAETETGETDWRQATETLAWAYALPELASRLEPTSWWRILDRLIALAAEPQETFALGTDPLSYQLLAGELPLVLSVLFPELNPCRRLLEAASETLSLSLDELFGNPDSVKSLHLSIQRPLLASYTRCRVLSRRRPWSGQADQQFRSLVLNSLRLSRRDGRQVLTQGASADWNAELFSAVLQAADNPMVKGAAVAALPPSRGLPKTAPRKRLPDAALHDEFSDVSILRGGWNRNDVLLALRHDRAHWQGELHNHRGPLLAGHFECEVRYRDQPLDFLGQWEEVCWVCDDDGQYLEMEIELSGGVKLDRQLFLAAADKFLYWADAVQVPEPGAIEYLLRLPLAPHAKVRECAQHREMLFDQGNRSVPFLPLALGEWRSDRRFGDLTIAGSHLQLTQRREGSNLYVPWFLDLAARSNRTPYTWRQLSVSQDRVRTPADQGVGYRVQLGHKQWLAYRSLTSPINRCVLGVNTTSEFLLSRFKDGEVENLVEVEGELDE